MNAGAITMKRLLDIALVIALAVTLTAVAAEPKVDFSEVPGVVIDHSLASTDCSSVGRASRC